MHAGAFYTAAALMDESDAITQATGTAAMIHAKPLLASWRGNEAEALALIESARRHASARGQGWPESMIEGASAVLLNGLGRYSEALAAAQRACAQHELGLYGQALAELMRPRSARAGPSWASRSSTGLRSGPARAAPTGRSAWRRARRPC